MLKITLNKAKADHIAMGSVTDSARNLDDHEIQPWQQALRSDFTLHFLPLVNFCSPGSKIAATKERWFWNQFAVDSHISTGEIMKTCALGCSLCF
jgi:hypothetical protein